MSYELSACLAVLGLFVVAMLSGKVPYALAGAIGMVLLVLSNAAPLEVAFSGFVNKNVIMLAGMYAMASLFGRTGLIAGLKRKLLSGSGGKSDLQLSLTLLGACAFLAQFTTSQSSIIMLMMPFLMSLDEEGEITMSRLLLPMVLVMTGWMNKLPIGGGGLTTYLMLNQFIEAAGGTELLDILSMTKTGLIPAVIVLLWSAATCKLLPKKQPDPGNFALRAGQAEQPMTKKEETVTYIGFAAILICMMFQKQLGDRVYAVPLAVIVAMICLGVCDGKWFLQTLVGGPVIMMAAVMGIAATLTHTGAGDLIGSTILKLLGGNPSGVLICVVIGLAATALTNFMGMTATLLVLCPIACSICVAAGIDCRAAALLAINCPLVTVTTPMSSNGALIAYGTCGLTLRDSWKWCIPATLVGVAANIAATILVYPPV